MINERELNRFKDIDDDMIWKGPALYQIRAFEELTESLGIPYAVVGDHTSKSIKLPVVKFTVGNMGVYIRDNFHDVGVCVMSVKPIEIPMGDLYKDVLEPKDWAWYLEQIARCRGYSWKGWSDEQMDDFGTLRVQVTREDGTTYTSKVEAERKDRWLKRMSDPEWFRKDWSSGTITCDGEFGPDAKQLWVQYRSYLEGIEALVPHEATEPFNPGCKGFAVALGEMKQAGALIKNLSEG